MVAIAFFLRLGLVVLNYNELPLSNHFERFGAEMGWTARSLATGQGFSSPFYPATGPTALVPPLFPFLLASIFRMFGVYSRASAFAVLALNSALSALTSAVIFFGLRHRFGLSVARLGAWLWALFPYAVYYSAVYLWDCALTSFLFGICFFAAWNRLAYAGVPAWIGWGMLAGLAALSNPSVVTLLPLLIAYAAWQRYRAGLSFAGRTVLCLAALCLTAAPWCIRNARVLHEAVLVRDGFWGEFYAGNCGDTSHSNPDWTHPASNPAEMRAYQQLGESGYMAWKRTLSMQHVRQYPAAFALVSARRALRFWTGYWSFSHKYLQDEPLDVPNVPFCTLLSLLACVGLVDLYRCNRVQAAPVLAILMLFPLPYYLTHSSIDYRQPIEPVLVTLVTLGVVRVQAAISSRRATHAFNFAQAG